MKRKGLKRIVASAFAIVISATMLLGATFAFFTDNVSSNLNKIEAGTLKVDLELLDKQNGWQSIKDSQAPIFNYDKWEPGYTDVKILKIENEGSLALKWKAKFISTEELTTLADVIEVYVNPSETELAYPTSRELAGYEKVGTVKEFVNTIEETTKGTLLPNDCAYLGIALKMVESAGNEYQGLSLGAFDITIVATQYDYESDSFDATYDKEITVMEDGNILVEENNIQYVYTNEGDAYLYLVTEDYQEETVVVPDGITNIGNYAFAYNSNVKEVILSSSVTSLGRGFDSSTVERVVLNEGLETIDSRAFRSTTALKEVVISSTVKTIADNAFQKSGIKEIVIPATVETIGETAFGASLIEKVTFEGNTSIQGYAFRGCPALRTVIMNGDNNEFIASTLNGRNSMWFCNKESNNPNYSDIDFYVKNEIVASRVKTAMGEEANNTDVYFNGYLFEAINTADRLQTVLNNAEKDTYILLTADISGDVVAPQKPGVNVIISGDNKSFKGVLTVDGKSGTYTTASLTINNVKFDAESISKDACIRLGDGTNVTRYTCNVTVSGCTFDVPGAVGVKSYTGGDKNLTITDCVATEKAHSLVQAKGIDGILVENCKVYSKNGLNFNNSTNVTVIECTVNTKGYAVRFGESSGGAGTAESYLIKDSALTSNCEDGDAVIILRGTADYATLTIENTTIIGTTEIANTATGATVIR